jgi:hypothetical protein
MLIGVIEKIDVIKIMVIIEIDCKGVEIEITEVDVIIIEETTRRSFIRGNTRDHRAGAKIAIPIDIENAMREVEVETEETNLVGDRVININRGEVRRRLE